MGENIEILESGTERGTYPNMVAPLPPVLQRFLHRLRFFC